MFIRSFARLANLAGALRGRNQTDILADLQSQPLYGTPPAKPKASQPKPKRKTQSTKPIKRNFPNVTS